MDTYTVLAKPVETNRLILRKFVEGDEITIDSVANRIDVKISPEEFAERQSKWVKPEPRYKRGVLAKFSKLTSTASEGAVTDGSL